MNTKLILLLLTFCFTFTFSQKKELYVNEDLKLISKTEFENETHNSVSSNFRFELDTCFLNVKVLKHKKGTIEMSLLDSIKKNFSKTNSQKINDTDILLINYYPGNDKCSTTSYKENFKKRHNQVNKKMNKIENLKQLFIYKSNENIKDFGEKINWQQDFNKLIETIFFPIDYPCGGYIIIDNKGNYMIERGEYCYSDLLIEQIQNFITSNN